MIVPVVLAAALASAYAQAFWQRDLGALTRLLAEHPDDTSPEHAFFADLVRFIDCEPLPNENLTPALAALRIEAARRARLPDAQSQTLWRDVLNPEFFHRDTAVAEPTGPILKWPADEEPWPDEVLHLSPPISRCGEPTKAVDELALLPLEVILQAERAGQAELASRLAYHRAVLLLRAGESTSVPETVRHIATAALPVPERSFARLIRLDAGVDTREGYAALADDDALGNARLHAIVQTCATAAMAQRWSDVAQLTTSVELLTYSQLAPGEAGEVRYLLAERARALETLGREEELGYLIRAAFPSALDATDEAATALRESAIAWLARQPFDPAAATALLTQLGPAKEQPAYWSTLGDEALAAQEAKTVDGVITRLLSLHEPRAQALALRLRGRLAFARNDRNAFNRTLAELFPIKPARPPTAQERATRDETTVVLLQDVLDQMAARPTDAWIRTLDAALEQCRKAVGWEHRLQVSRLQQAAVQLRHKKVDALNEIAVGELRIPRKRASLVPPPAEVTWPELPSLIAIPTPDGRWVDWFSTEMSHLAESGRRGGAQP